MQQTEAEWRAFEAQAAAARERPAQLEKLAYRTPGTVSVPAQPSAGEAAKDSEAVSGALQAADHAAAIASLEAQLHAAELAAAARLEQAEREHGERIAQLRQEGERQAREAGEAWAQQVGAALRSFHAEREEYFAKVEREVVRLALAIAARILNREALLDPLLLAGAVRVALGQLGETTGVRLRCPMEQAEQWREMLRRLPNLAHAPEVEGDPGLKSGDCLLEARVGTVDLGVRAQLEEIERGFFDLLEQRPGSAGFASENILGPAG